MAAGIQAGHMGLSVVIMERSGWGGRLVLARKVENFPGLPEPLSGSRVVERMVAHARGKGLLMNLDSCESIECVANAFVAHGANHNYEAKAVIAAVGVEPKRLVLPGAASDRRRIFYSWRDIPEIRGKGVLIIGGGEIALDQACTLAEKGAFPTLLIRGSAPRSFDKLVQEAVALGAEVKLNSTARRVEAGDGHISVEIAQNGLLDKQDADYVLVAIGSEPCGINISASARAMAGRGLYWAGDVDSDHRQAAIAVGDGIRKAMIVYEHLREVQ